MVRVEWERQSQICENPHTVLLVEDEVLVRLMIADKLRNAGVTVIEASSAQEALEVLRHSNVAVRLILSDIQMPGALEGIGLARKVRSEYPVIKIVLTSGYLTALDWTDHDGLFPTPYKPDRLIQHIKTLLD